MSVPPTPLQSATRALALVFSEARETLDESSYETFVAVDVVKVESEAGRLLIGEALRALRGEP